MMGRSRAGRRTGIVIVWMAALLWRADGGLPAAGQAEATPPLPPDLVSVFERGPIFQDRNGDEVVDFVDARLVLASATPALEEVAAAAEIAARLGFETTAMDLPITAAPASRPAIVVGTAAAAPEWAFWAAAGLRPGEGTVAARVEDGRLVVHVLGGDGAGTLAAARAFAGRLPMVWNARGPDLAAVRKGLADWIGEQGVAGARVSLSGVAVRADADAFDSLALHVEAPDAASQAVLAASLRRLARERGASGQGRTAGARQAPPARPAASRAPGDGAAASLAPAAGPARAGRADGGAPGSSPPAGAPQTGTTSRPAGAPGSGPPLSYAGARTLVVRLAAPGAAPAVVSIPQAAEPAPAEPPEPPARRPGGGAKDALDLSTLYSIDGGLGDSNSDLIPDRVDVVLCPSGEGVSGTIDLAARLGLEATGLAIPLIRLPGEIRRPEAEPPLVLIGIAHPLVDRLVEQKKFERPALAPGEGLVQLVPKAFGEKPALIVTGADAGGLARALDQAATRLPHLWTRGKDRPTVDDVEEEVQRFLRARTPAGQAATALYKLERLAGPLAGRDLEAAHVKVFVERPAPGLDAVVREVAARSIRADRLEVTVESLDVQEGKPISVGGTPISETFDVPSEVDEFWQVFRTRVLPAVKKRQPVTLEARLSEPPELRRRIEREVREALARAGAAVEGTTVRVLSAYKQGFSWLQEVVGEALRGQPVDRLVIRYAEIGPPPEWKQQAMFTPTRWLLEAFPIDEVLARDLGIPLERIAFEKRPIGSPAYEVVATAADGRVLLRETFEPKFVVRPYFDRFPDYEKVRVTTGWILARQGGRTLADQRIVTDVERFWDHFQAKTLPAIYEYVMALTEGKPRASKAPHFGELVVDLTLSEPDYPLGIDKEQIAPMEAMHEDLYFGVLHFFDVLGRHARGQPLTYPGRVIPIMRPKGDGRPGRAAITFTGFGADEPSVVLEYRERGGAPATRKLPVPHVALERPSALAAVVRDGAEGIVRLDVRVKVDTERDERDELVKRTRAERVDDQILSAEQVAAVVGHLARLRAAGLYRDALAWPGLGTMRLVVGVAHEPKPGADRLVALEPNGAPAPLPDIRICLPDGWTPGSRPVVQWDTPIPPLEACALLAKMSSFPEATVYKVGRSYLGKDIWAMDLMPEVKASHWSQAKATVVKPTVIYSARQHANEVSSTSHVLKLAELLLTDPTYRKKLDRVNVVIHPVTNPDGAQLAYDLYRITPDHMLHAGYLGSLGVDVTSDQWDADPLYPESRIRPKLWRTWLPDIFLNPHGYPSHEWVQLFSEYAGWVRSRVTESRDWWGMRGWFTPGFGYVDDPRYPRHKEAAFEIRDRFTRAIQARAEVRALNERAYARYRRYGVDHDGENFKMDLTNGVLVYTALKGARASASSQDFMTRNPAVTIWTGSTEAPDETAHGDWMKLVATAGLQWDTALLDYLVESPYEVERRREPFAGGVSLSLSRARPPRPKTESAEPTAGSRQHDP
jgi:hypothetical protein